MRFWRYFQISTLCSIILLLIRKSESTVDYSQFYLPPCCFPAAISRLSLPPHAHEPLYPSPTENHHQNEISYRKDTETDTILPEQSKIVENILSFMVINGTTPAARNKSDSLEKFYDGKIFKYLIPLTIIPEENRERKDAINNDNFTEIKLVNDNEFAEKNQSQSLQKFKRFIDFSDLTPEEKGKRISFIQKVLNRKPGWKFPDENQITENTNTNTNTKSRYEVLNSVPLVVQKPEKPLLQSDDYDYSSKIDPRNVQSTKSQFKNNKMPSSWLLYLKRALFQSMIADKEKKNVASSTTTTTNDEDLSKSSSNNILISNEGPNEQTKQLWNQILDAKLMTIDPLTKTASEIPELIYLPPGQVASGLVVNTETGIEFRISPELYQNNYHHHQHPIGNTINNLLNLRQEAKEECNCHLINHGDILVAYWSVSRILNEQNQPSLQYLLHPVQHNVPTPPLLFPFGEGLKTINPSPIDTFFHPQHHQQFLYHQNIKPIIGSQFRNSKALHLHQHQQHPQSYIVNNPNSIHQQQVQIQHQHQLINQQHPQNYIVNNPNPIHKHQIINHLQQNQNFVQFPINNNQRVIIETKHGVTPILFPNNNNLYRNVFENNLRREDAILTEKVLHDFHRHHHHQQNLVPPPVPPQIPPIIQHHPSPVPPPIPIPQYHLQSHHHNHNLPPLPPRLNHPKSIQEIISPGNQVLLPPPIPYENNNLNLPHPLGIYGHNYGQYIEKPPIHLHDFDIQAKNHDNNNKTNDKRVQNEMKTYNKNQQLQKKNNMVNEPSYILDF